jgi:deazaflavin-dependent oxidoreductase (nitroreductase family)
MDLYVRAMRSLSTTKGMRWMMRTVQHPLDMKLRGTRFAPSTFGGMDAPLCFLTTIGRTSGEPRTVPLLYVQLEDECFAVVATNYGQHQTPAWALNLDATPHAELEVDGQPPRNVVARRASDASAAGIWPRFHAVWPGYETYRDIAGRPIGMYLLCPAG